MPGWITNVRAVLELLYFASGIAIALTAFLGLRQLKIGLEQVSISKEVARANAKRESVKYAAEQCRYFAEVVVSVHSKFASVYNDQKLTFLSTPTSGNQPPFVIQNGEIVPKGYSFSTLEKEWSTVAIPLVSGLSECLRVLESFAIPFAEGVADEDIGYRETARPFCQEAQICLAAIFHLRRLNKGRYESLIKLLSLWSNRLAAEAAVPVLDLLGGLVKEASKGRIKPIEPVF